MKTGDKVAVYEDHVMFSEQEKLFEGVITQVGMKLETDQWIFEGLVEVELEDGSRKLLRDFQCKVI